MAPKLSPEQVDNKLVEIRLYVRAHLADLTARGAASLQKTFAVSKKDIAMIDSPIRSSFYKFLWREEKRFTESQRNFADDTFALLAQHRQSSDVYTRAGTGSAAASSNSLQRDRS